MRVPQFLIDDKPTANRPSWFDMLLPPQAMVMVILLLITVPVALLAGESLLEPFFDWVQSVFSAESASTIVDTLPSFFFIKFITFLVLCFFGGVQLLLRINTIYYGTWSLTLDQAHPLHPPYQPDPQLSTLALLNWSIYRLLQLAGPPLLMIGLMFGLGFLEIYLFNLLSLFPVFGLPLQLILGTFLFLLTGVLTLFVCLRSVWVLLYTLFGDVMAVTEPDLSVRSIFDRCRRIALVTPGVIALYPAYAVFCIGVLVATVWLLVTYNIEDIIQLKANFIQLLGIECLLFGLYLLLNFWNLSAYHTALTTYYQRLPVSLKERLSASR